jgi:hypothetical protein
MKLAALFALLATVASIAFTAGLTVGARRWRARALYAADLEQLRKDTGGHLDTCIDKLAEARVACPGLEPVRWK